MQTVATKLEQALCANHEILTFLPHLFVRFEAPESAETVRRSLLLFQSGLSELTAAPQELDALVVDEMISAHAEIAAAVAAALELAKVPRELIEQIGAVFDEFATGLRSLTAAAA